MHISYTHRDRLGSAATFTNAQNSVTARRHFDAFGKPRNGDWSQLESLSLAAQLGTNLLDTSMTTRRGFTDHEHLDEAELIHMNGRVYDYNVGRFMSVDPVIQSPTNTQSVNPYSYIMNNPMSGIDPSGYCSTSDEVQTCFEGIENGETKDITNADGEVVGSISKDEDGKISVKSNGANSSGVNGILNISGSEAADIGSEIQKAKRDAVISKDVYEGNGDLESVGVKKVSDSELDELGIDKTIFEDEERESGFKSGLYKDTEAGEYICIYRN
ncbi:RHS repeat domain-containing protein, partial [Alteromonas sp. a30]|uniref:RHS repeat domain-containing protein n=1 Tax=Alteromonas sp. a30 TaxID=2730917 RepID=UPI002DDCE9E4